MHKNSQLLFLKHAAPLFRPGMRVLEIGPDGHPSTYLGLVKIPNLIWETIDIFDDKRLTYRAIDEYNFPLPNDSYDLVISGQVIEHVRKTWHWIRELTRVCKPGGRIVTVNPVSWGFHQAPIDCWRIYPDGMRALHDDAGLVTEHSAAESLEPWYYSIARYSQFFLRMAVGYRRPRHGCPPIVDTLSIARKPMAQGAAA
jgi:SAM-dependent methyltransferase